MSIWPRVPAPKFSRVFLFILFNFCHTTRTFVSVDWILCWWKFELFPAIVREGGRGRKAFEPCKFQMILHERVPIIVWLEAYCFFFRHPSYRLYSSIRSFLSYLPSFLFYLMDAENEKNKGEGTLIAFFFFFFSFSFLLVFGYTWWWDCIIISTAIEETPQTVEIMKLRRGWSNWGWLSPHIWSAKPLPARVLCAYENRVCPPSLLPSSFASFARENSCVSYPFDVVASNKISSDMIDDHADCVVHRFVDLSIV